MIVRPFILGAAATLLLIASHAVAQEPAAKDKLDLRYENGIVAVVEDQAITVEEVRRELVPLLAELQRQHKSEAEYNKAVESLQGEIIQNLIDRVLIIKEFRKDEKNKIPGYYIDQEISDTQNRQFEGDRSKFLAYLRAKGKTQKEYRKEVEEDIIYSYMTHQKKKSTSIISPVRIETYYNENKDRFYQDDAVELRLIQINRNALTEEQLRAAADNVVTRLEAGEKFETSPRKSAKMPARIAVETGAGRSAPICARNLSTSSSVCRRGSSPSRSSFPKGPTSSTAMTASTPVSNPSLRSARTSSASSPRRCRGRSRNAGSSASAAMAT